jgi:lysozyme
MKAGQAKIELQRVLELPVRERGPNIGPKTRAAFERLAVTPNDKDWPPLIEGEPSSPRRQINQAGLDLVRHFESFFPDAYWDATGKCWTIGWGHTGLQHKDGTVYSGRRISRQEGDELLSYDMRQFEARVSTLVQTPLTDDQFAALVSFDFNTGGLHRSTLLRLLNEGDYEGAAKQFELWTRSGGKVLNGLVRRRKSERRLFESKHPAIIT